MSDQDRIRQAIRAIERAMLTAPRGEYLVLLALHTQLQTRLVQLRVSAAQKLAA